MLNCLTDRRCIEGADWLAQDSGYGMYVLEECEWLKPYIIALHCKIPDVYLLMQTVEPNARPAQKLNDRIVRYFEV